MGRSRGYRSRVPGPPRASAEPGADTLPLRVMAGAGRPPTTSSSPAWKSQGKQIARRYGACPRAAVRSHVPVDLHGPWVDVAVGTFRAPDAPPIARKQQDPPRSTRRRADRCRGGHTYAPPRHRLTVHGSIPGTSQFACPTRREPAPSRALTRCLFVSWPAQAGHPRLRPRRPGSPGKGNREAIWRLSSGQCPAALACRSSRSMGRCRGRRVSGS